MTREKITSIKELKLKANDIRKDLLISLNNAGSGHSAGSLGMADVFTAIYFNVADINPDNPKWDKRDRIVLSNGHICPVLYTTMAHAGFFPVSELMTLRKLGTRLHGHPHNLELPGLETSSGPLGQGISQAVGMALAAKMKKQDHKVYCLMGDGEINEGQAWEAFMFASHYNLSNLIVVLDRNFIQIDGNTEDVMALEPLDKKYEAFGFHVITTDGNDMASVIDAFSRAKEESKEKPVVIIANTIPGKGVSFIENDHRWHGKVPNDEELKKAIEELEYEKERIMEEKRIIEETSPESKSESTSEATSESISESMTESEYKDAENKHDHSKDYDKEETESQEENPSKYKEVSQ